MPQSLSNIKKTRLVLLSAGVLLLSAAIVYSVLHFTSRSSSPEVEADIITYSTDTPDETKPDASFSWKGASHDPKKIIIPSLGVDAYIQNVGVDQHNEVAVPNNLHVAGWFVDSVRPGERGLSIIDGHVDLRPNRPDAVFQHLGTIQPDAEITVVFGDESTKTFKVVKVQDVALEEAAGVLFSSLPSGERQLNLVTCGGKYDEAADRLDRRIIVSAELAAS